MMAIVGLAFLSGLNFAWAMEAWEQNSRAGAAIYAFLVVWCCGTAAFLVKQAA